MEKEYAGHLISLTNDCRFAISGPTVSAEEYRGTLVFDTFAEAMAKIDQRLKAQESQDRERLSITVLTEAAEAVVITGMHGRNLNMLGIPSSVTRVYPPEKWLADLLKERVALTKRNREIGEMLDRYAISNKPDYVVKTHEAAVAWVKREVVTKAAAAQQFAPAA